MGAIKQNIRLKNTGTRELLLVRCGSAELHRLRLKWKTVQVHLLYMDKRCDCFNFIYGWYILLRSIPLTSQESEGRAHSQATERPCVVSVRLRPKKYLCAFLKKGINVGYNKSQANASTKLVRLTRREGETYQDARLCQWRVPHCGRTRNCCQRQKSYGTCEHTTLQRCQPLNIRTGGVENQRSCKVFW